ncbi:MAG: ATP-dependent Clp protease adaptor ClpS [Saprospiraceae bacterium]|nr:ATP-dependent Clp protease adaptor ClpS [Saprospiraceae bacterium]
MESLFRISNFEKPLWEEEEDILVEDQIDTGSPAYLIVYNDDHNTFEWVIECFMTVLQHTSEQSEQLAIMIHYKGKATVKTGTRSILLPLCSALLDRGLSAEVEGGEEEA